MSVVGQTQVPVLYAVQPTLWLCIIYTWSLTQHRSSDSCSTITDRNHHPVFVCFFLVVKLHQTIITKRISNRNKKCSGFASKIQKIRNIMTATLLLSFVQCLEDCWHDNEVSLLWCNEYYVMSNCNGTEEWWERWRDGGGGGCGRGGGDECLALE